MSRHVADINEHQLPLSSPGPAWPPPSHTVPLGHGGQRQRPPPRFWKRLNLRTFYPVFYQVDFLVPRSSLRWPLCRRVFPTAWSAANAIHLPASSSGVCPSTRRRSGQPVMAGLFLFSSLVHSRS
ncbi:hypothetical protein HJG60_008163 [Phyllostomus discolor]|uniref:Uncharacterized protein n=1 Tax=Phyllostomus discolor TaxID=89673 RepID=A0A833Z914_9CHIR|nr:hypothetical protein HJG60_008163 [Phyllostomus discolor]